MMIMMMIRMTIMTMTILIAYLRKLRDKIAEHARPYGNVKTI